jgi:hypothetical protein
MRRVIVLAALLAPLAASIAWAGTTPEYRLFAGAYIPTGNQADLLKSSAVVGMQGGVEVKEMLHLIATVAYATPRPKGEAFTDVHIYQYDAGAELFHVYSSSSETNHWTVRPFIGAGLGARTYDPQHSTVGSQTDFTGYGSLGGELQHANIAVRLEARDYVTRFNGFRGELDAKTYNSLVVGGGLAYHF